VETNDVVERERSTWAGKADFAGIYTAPDPRPYYAALRELDYRLPEHSVAAFRRVIAAMPEDHVVIADVCCSYGVNATILRHALSLSDVYQYFARPVADDALAVDRSFFIANRDSGAPSMIGVDSSGPAIDYAVRTSLIDEGFAENLEMDEPSPGLVAALEDCRLITVSGGIGYISPLTLTRLVEAMPRPPWIAVTVLRQVPYQPFIDAFAEYGLTTRRLGRPFRQRRFADNAERDAAVARLEELGRDPNPDDGYYYAECFVSQPLEAEGDAPTRD